MSLRGNDNSPFNNDQRARLGLAAIVIASAVAIMGLAQPPAATAATVSAGTLSLAPGAVSTAKIGAKRTTALVETIIATPSARPVAAAIQFRSPKSTSGYRAQLTFAIDGSVAASFSTVKSGVETAIGKSLKLGISVKAGDQVHLEATVAAKRHVKLYLRAWKAGDAKPRFWQLAATDSSSRRYKVAGSVYFWAGSAAATSTTVAFSTQKVVAYTARKAAAVGVESPSTATPTPSAPTGSDTFSLAVIGDTQDEIYRSTDTRFSKRTAWLATNKDKLGLKYVLQTGDLGSWAWLATSQYVNAKNAMTNLNNANIPYSIAVGNHDTNAVGWDGIAGSSGLGGSAFASSPRCIPMLGAASCNSNYLVRQTGAFNSYFPLSGVKAVGGAYEAGKADNIWTTFSANNTKWLVLTLELWQRPAVVAWAKTVVANHPDYNVIISTHSYLDGGGTISRSNGGYGATAPSYLYDQVVSKYSNVKMVFSGHTGTANNRQDTPNGNTVVSYVGNELGQDATLRMLNINTKTGAVTSTVYNAAFTSVGNTSNTIKVIG